VRGIWGCAVLLFQLLQPLPSRGYRIHKPDANEFSQGEEENSRKNWS